MLRGLMSSLLLAVIFAGSSCSVIPEEPIEFSPDRFTLDGSRWALKKCPHDPFLIINGHTDCEYLSTLEFRDGMVYITYSGAEEEVPHHICYMNGSTLSVSVQACSSSSWRPMFEWDVIAMDENTLVMEIEMPAIMASYHVRFDYQRID